MATIKNLTIDDIGEEKCEKCGTVTDCIFLSVEVDKSDAAIVFLCSNCITGAISTATDDGQATTLIG